MQITQEELERRLKSPKNLSKTLSVPIMEETSRVIPIEKGKRSEPLTIPQQITVGTLAHQMSGVEVAKEFGITPAQVYGAKHSNNPSVKGPIQATISRVQELALDKMMQALGLMTEEKFTNASLKDLSIVSANMAKIIEKTTMREDDSKVQILIYAPEMRKESSYKMIDV